jgi:signal recognition particle GTPase
MDELAEVKRVVERQAEVDEVLLVSTPPPGQNGLTQAGCSATSSRSPASR